MSLTVSSQVVAGLTIIELQGAVDDAVLGLALASLQSLATDGGRLVIDLDELPVVSRAPFEALLAAARDAEMAADIALICRRHTSRRKLDQWGISAAVPVYKSLDELLAHTPSHA